TYRLPNGVSPATAADHYLAQLEAVLDQQHQQIAALVIEPLVQGAAGMVKHPAGYLRGARALTRKYDVLLIADEIATGFGRTGTMFACQQEEVAPDLMCLGKGLTGGYLPMAATLASDAVWEAFLGSYAEAKTFFHGHTYGGNPLAAAAALASLDVFHEEQTLAHLPAKIERLGEHLQRMAQHPHVGDVRQCGLLAGIELVAQQATKTPYPWEEKRGIRACQHALADGVWLRPLGNVVVIMPPLAISLEELDRICLAAEKGILAATD
nr:aminotransferase class III-fold pyridoxal phosphate-dependent enzyme [Planctomycetales bacterium]